MFAVYSLLFLVALSLTPRSTDPRLQAALNEAMLGEQGAAVVLDVKTGELLASYRIEVAARRVATPGSTVKPFTLLALLESGAITKETALACPHTVRIGERNLDCSHSRTDGPIGPVTALAYSCNHFFSKLSERLSYDALYRRFSAAGLDALTGRWETEMRGTVQLPASRESAALMSLGEDKVAVTPLALAEAYRKLALRLRSPQDATPELQVVLEGLEAAVELGTAQSAASKKIRVAGKTGTSGGHAWFAGFAPASRPEIALVIFLERGSGGADAAPVAGRVFTAYAARVGAR